MTRLPAHYYIAGEAGCSGSRVAPVGSLTAAAAASTTDTVAGAPTSLAHPPTACRAVPGTGLPAAQLCLDNSIVQLAMKRGLRGRCRCCRSTLVRHQPNCAACTARQPTNRHSSSTGRGVCEAGGGAAPGGPAVRHEAEAHQHDGSGTKRSQVMRTPEKAVPEEAAAPSPSRQTRTRRRLAIPQWQQQYDMGSANG
jgi:hypothetical protein